MENVKDKIEKQLKDSGSISSKDIANLDVGKEAKEDRGVELDKTTTTPLTDKIKNDPLISQAAKANISELIEEDTVTAANVLTSHKNLLLPDEQKEDTIVITPEEKTTFISAILDNNRCVLSFSFMDNKLNVKIRSRTQDESYAMYYFINREMQDGKLGTQLAYSTRLRNIMLTAQVAEINGITQPELKLPLLAVADGDKIIPPGWVEQVTAFENKPDALLEILFKVLRIFEHKYLTMIESANDQNFWKTEQST
ncbi:hypothetical protein ACFLQL_00215 [Verrucomicrobiota bacterium]